MKTAISVPDHVFELSGKLAKRLKTSRSAVFSMAVEKLGKEVIDEDEEFIQRINDVCAEVDTSLDPVLKEYQRRRMLQNEWK